MIEKELAKFVIEWLERNNWEIYQEVQFHGYGKIADIAAVKNDLLWIIETKTSLGLGVMEQAWKWRTHYRSIAVPQIRNHKDRSFAYMLCGRYLNIGVLEVVTNKYFNSYGKIRIRIDAPLMQQYENESYVKMTLLSELHKTYAEAGSTAGSHLTPYKYTMIQIRKFLEKNPGSTLNEIIENIGKAHYRSKNSAKGAIRQALNRWEDWCEVDKSSKEFTYFVKP